MFKYMCIYIYISTYKCMYIYIYIHNTFVYVYIIMVFRIDSGKIKGLAEDSSLLPQEFVISLRYNGD